LTADVFTRIPLKRKAETEWISRDPVSVPKSPQDCSGKREQSHGPRGHSFMSMDENKINAEQNKQVFITFI